MSGASVTDQMAESAGALWIPAKAAALRLGVSGRTVQRWCQSRAIAAHRVGMRRWEVRWPIRWKPHDVDSDCEHTSIPRIHSD